MTSRRVSILVAAALAGLLSAAAPRAARATDYAVSPTGSDTATGLSGAPWRTIQRALTTVKAGDTVTVEDGTYAGLACDGVSGTAAAPIVFRSRNRWGAKITSATSASTQDFVQLASCSFITFDGFEVSGAPRSGIAILGNVNDGSDARGVIIQNCFSHDNGGTSTAGRHDGIFSGFALDLTIQDNRIDTAGEHGIYVSNAADNPAILRNDVSNTGNNCIQINADLSTGGDGLISNWRIEGNTVRNCKGSAGFNLDGAIHGVARNNVIFNAAKAGIAMFQIDGAEASHDNLIVNNTIYDPVGSRSAIQVADGANNNVIFNNILISQSTGLEVQNVTGLQHDYNLVSSYSGTTASAHEATPANAAALFLDAAGGDLRLAALTPPLAVDQGAASLGGMSAPTTDLLGAPRPAGAGFDIGAYESGSVAPPTGGTGGGSAGAGGNAGRGGAGGGSAGTGGAGGRGGASSGGNGGATGGTGGAGSPPGAASGGCGCRAAGPGGAIFAVPISMMILRRRRRRASC
ncbi:MAG TPA: right-handed parallel beta-helix repeat-containing protein [Polyangia bacterium]|nr:right-handed parallel beta-helix repeat-containing protein [Polyangia bacterium]